MKEIPFSAVLSALDDNKRIFPAKYIGRFSDLPPADLDSFMQVWARMPQPRKHLLLEKMVELFETDTLLSFESLAVRLLEERDGQVRIFALRLLSETGDVHLLPRLIQMVDHDPEPVARAEAAALLGQFVEMGELEELPAENLKQATDCLLRAASDSDGQLARAALEALGHSSRSEVNALIESAFQHRDPRWQASALVAAGRSADVRWQERVLESFLSEDQSVRLAAVRAAGELELKPARQFLLNMIEDEDDDEVFQAIIWSLSLIGGEDVRTYLQTLIDDTEDDDILEFLEDALHNLSFTEDAADFDLLAVDEGEPMDRKRRA